MFESSPFLMKLLLIILLFLPYSIFSQKLNNNLLYSIVLDNSSKKSKKSIIIDSTINSNDELVMWYNPEGYDRKKEIEKIAKGDSTWIFLLRNLKAFLPITTSLIANKSDFNKKVSIVSQSKINKIGHTYFWQKFYRRYPFSDGIYRFSDVYYDSVNQRAILIYTHSCHNLCGSGNIVLFEKVNNQWSFKGFIRLFIS